MSNGIGNWQSGVQASIALSAPVRATEFEGGSEAHYRPPRP